MPRAGHKTGPKQTTQQNTQRAKQHHDGPPNSDRLTAMIDGAKLAEPQLASADLSLCASACLPHTRHLCVCCALCSFRCCAVFVLLGVIASST